MKLVFVYNADSGVFNTLSDIAHKILSPDTYECNLCNLTHGYFTAREEWVSFLTELDCELEFLHRDEFFKRQGHRDDPLPAIYQQENDQYRLWIDSAQINAMQTTAELKQLIRSRIESASGDKADNSD